MITSLLFAALVVGVSLGGAGFAGAGGAAASSSPQSPAVALRSLDVAGGLPVEDKAAVGRASSGFGPVAPPQGSSGTAGRGPTAGQLSGPFIPRGAPALDTGMRFTMLGLICDVPTVQGSVSVWLRTSLDASSWSRWFVAPLELAAEEGGRTRAFTEPLWTGAARFVQARAVGGGSAPLWLTGVRLVALAPEIGVDLTGPAGADAGAGRAAAAGLPPRRPGRRRALRRRRPARPAPRLP